MFQVQMLTNAVTVVQCHRAWERASFAMAMASAKVFLQSRHQHSLDPRFLQIPMLGFHRAEMSHALQALLPQDLH